MATIVYQGAEDIVSEEIDDEKLNYLEEAWPSPRREPTHPDCWAEAFGDPPWFDG